MLTAGCAPVPAEAVATPPSTPAYVPPPSAYEQATATSTESVETDVAYDDAPPVDDVEDYPSVVYEGAPVYYVGGVWYRHDPRGWGVYRREPQALVEPVRATRSRSRTRFSVKRRIVGRAR